ncbi:sulfite exporter TauE/SafE family protein, partial [[Eubacterium] cellulosolvens]
NLVFGLKTHIAVGTSLVTTLFTAISATTSYYKQKIIDYKVGGLMLIGTIPGGVLGAYTTKWVGSIELASIFGISMILISLRFLISKHQPQYRNTSGYSRTLIDSKGKVIEYSIKILPGLGMSFLAGFFSGFLGIGGGFIIVPVLRFIVGVPMHLAVAISLFIMIFTTFSGVAVHAYLGNIIIWYALSLALGVTVGAQVGTNIVRKLSAVNLERLFGVSLFLIGLRMIAEAFI